MHKYIHLYFILTCIIWNQYCLVIQSVIIKFNIDRLYSFNRFNNSGGNISNYYFSHYFRHSTYFTLDLFDLRDCMIYDKEMYCEIFELVITWKYLTTYTITQ